MLYFELSEVRIIGRLTKKHVAPKMNIIRMTFLNALQPYVLCIIIRIFHKYALLSEYIVSEILFESARISNNRSLSRDM